MKQGEKMIIKSFLKYEIEQLNTENGGDK